MDILHGLSIEKIEENWGEMVNDIKNPKIRRATAIMLENQHKDMNGGVGSLNEADTQSSFQRAGGYSGDGMFHKLAVPMVRRTFPELIAHDIVGVQPMTGPIGLAFALRFKAGVTGHQYNSSTNVEIGYNTIDGAFSGAAGPAGMATSASEGLGSYTPGTSAGGMFPNSETSPGLGIGTGQPINEVSFTLEKQQVEAKTRKLRSRWSIEVAADLKAMHGLNLEEEMMDILAYEITAEIDREIMNSVRVAAAANTNSGALSWTSSANFDGRWEAEKYRNLYNRVVRDANKIAISTRRGPGNFVVANPTVCAALEATSAFIIAPVKNDIDTAKMGVAYVGTLGGRFKLYRDTFWTTNDQYVVGYKGKSAYDAGVIYMPYVQLQLSKAIMEDSFNPSIGLMSRYGVLNSLWGASNFYVQQTITSMP